jgi:copper chaperone CopZ
MISETFTVAGMTCQHCVRAVTAEVEVLPAYTTWRSIWSTVRSPSPVRTRSTRRR